jgi:RimJ/RimL family protein N-acetyltransferase
LVIKSSLTPCPNFWDHLYNSQKNHPFQSYIVFDGNTFIGYMCEVYFPEKPNTVYIGGWVKKENRAKGYFTAMIHLLIKDIQQTNPEMEIESSVRFDNHASLRVMSKVGFTVGKRVKDQISFKIRVK